MAKVKISEFDVNPDNNTDINNINIAEGCAPSGINNAIRQLMSDLKEFQTGAGGDSITAVGVYSDTVGEKTSGAGVTVDGVLLKDNGITASGTNVLSGTTIPSSKTLVVTTDIGTSVQAYDADTTKNDVANTFTANQIISVTDNSNAALRITQLGTGNALLVEDSTNPDSTPFVVNADGSVGIGVTTPTSLLDIAADGVVQPLITRYSTDGNPSRLFLRKSRGTRSSPTSVASGDIVSEFTFSAYDGANFIQAARIDTVIDGTPGTNDMPGRLVFSTTADGASSPTERMRIDSAGRVGIGGNRTDTNLVMAKSITGATTVFGLLSNGQIQSDVTTQYYGFNTGNGTQAASFTLGALSHYRATQGTFGAGSAVTTQHGFIAESTLTGATNNFGFYSNIASGTGRWNFYAAGTADNYFAGSLGIGTTGTEAKFTVESGTQFAIASARTTTSILARGTGTAGAGAYGGSITFAQINSSRPWGAIAGVQYSTDVDQGGLAFFYKSGATTNDTVVEGMRLDAAGNVGIGTSSPQSKLHIAGSTFVTGDTGLSGITADGITTRFLSSVAYLQAVNVSSGTVLGGRDISLDGNQLLFRTISGASFTERIRIDSSGNLLVGTTSATGSRADFFYDPGSSITPVISTRHQSSTGSSYATHLSFLNNSGTQVGYISANGSATFYGTSSDYRLKENIAPITGALAKVQELKPVTYKWKADGSNGEGFIAHELQEVLPECVVGEKDAVDAEGNPQYQGIDTSFLVATLTAAIQEQQAIINDLKTRIETLESK
jgi:hypothetical protein